MTRSHRWGLEVCALCAWMSIAATVQAQAPKPERRPSPSPAAAGTTQSSQLPAGTDSGEPGTSQTPRLSGTAAGDNTRRNLLQREAATASGAQSGIDDSAAARAAARPSRLAGPAAGASAVRAASSPGPSRKPSPPSR